MFASARPSVLGQHVLRAARAQLRQVATEVLDSALQHLDNRALKASRSAARTGKNQTRAPTTERMREVLERDRAVTQASPTTAPRAAERAAVVDEPIRTRTLATLLAAQGYRERALAMYEWLAEQNPSDETLRAEAVSLRATRV